MNDYQKQLDFVKELIYITLNALEMHQKTTLKDLIDKIVAETGLKISIANGIVPMIAHEWADAGNGSIDKGRNGGIYRGGKQVRSDPRVRCESCHQVLRKSTTEE